MLRNIYHARKNHKLDEWRKFCEFIESLPYSELITVNERESHVNSEENPTSLNEKIKPETVCVGVLSDGDYAIHRRDLPITKRDCIYYQPEGVTQNHEYCCYDGHPLDSKKPTFGGCLSCDKYVTLAQMTEVYKGE